MNNNNILNECKILYLVDRIGSVVKCWGNNVAWKNDTINEKEKDLDNSCKNQKVGELLCSSNVVKIQRCC